MNVFGLWGEVIRVPTEPTSEKNLTSLQLKIIEVLIHTHTHGEQQFAYKYIQIYHIT